MGRPVRTGYNELSGAVSCRTFVPLPVCSRVRSGACVRGEEVIFDTRPACVDHFISLAGSEAACGNRLVLFKFV